MSRSYRQLELIFIPLCALLTVALIFLFPTPTALAQDQEKIERKVQNPIGTAEDEQRALRRNQTSGQLSVAAKIITKPEEDLEVSADAQEAQGNVIIYSGNVRMTYADIILIGDRATFNSATNDVAVEGNVFFEQKGQSVTAERIEFNLETKRGTLFKSTIFTDRTPDETTIVADAKRTDKIGEETFTLADVTLTACQEPVPKWSFTAKRARIKVNDRATLYHPLFRIKNIPILYLPYVSLSISKKDRSSGFLLPTSGSSNIKGRTMHVAYYQTLGRSADLLIRTDIFTKRGLGVGFDFRARPDEKSRLAFGSFIVKDRLLGEKRDAFGNKLPDQGGSSFYADAVQYFPNGFVAVADVNIISNFAFRQVFAENAQLAISPEERSQVYVNKNWGAYSFNASLKEQSIFLQDQIITTRQLPSFELNKRNEKISDSIPFYFSFESAIEGVKRTVTQNGITNFRTPNISQRFDFLPSITLPLKPVAGFTFTPSLSFRSTYYSDRFDPVSNQVNGENLFRNYGDVALDIRAPSFARTFRDQNGNPKMKHVIEPFLTYHFLKGIDDFRQTIVFDERDLLVNTNELEYGITNRFFVKRAVGEGQAKQAHEWLALTVAQKHFFDAGFDGALVDGKRNQFLTSTTLTGFASLGYRRDFSPLNVNARFRPSNNTYTDIRMNFDTLQNEVRDLSVSSGIIRSLFSLSQSWYYTRRIQLSNTQVDPTTLPGNQLDTSAFLGTPQKGPYMGLTVAYDFRDQFFDGIARDPRIVNLVTTGGWAWDCCSFQFQNYTFKAGLRNENRFLFSFTLKGVGTFGTDNVGQRRRR